MKLNSNQIDIMHHTKHNAANGLFGSSTPDEDMMELVSLGLMKSRGKVSFAPDEWFCLTEEGEVALRKFRPKERRRMNIVILNYRKGKKADIPCRCCVFSVAPKPSQTGRRMLCEYGNRHALVGLNTTCDKSEEIAMPF